MNNKNVCKNCFYNVNFGACGKYPCSDNNYSEFKPKEETKMEKPIFESEEQLRNFIEKHIFFTNDNTIAFVSIVESVRNAGLIKKSSLEIARENYEKWILDVHSLSAIPPEPYDLIQELEKEITRLSGKQ